jgi:hypothetical protein
MYICYKEKGVKIDHQHKIIKDKFFYLNFTDAIDTGVKKH